MSRLVILSDYLESAFEEGSRPLKRTFVAWCERGEYPDGTLIKRGRRYYVNLDIVNKNEADRLAEAATT